MRLILLFVFVLAYSLSGYTCSMYKLTIENKTIVGNNEDWFSPNHQFWYEPGSKDEYGVMYMGQLNNFAQGAINEAGLVFDGFGNPFLDIKNVENKKNIPIPEVVNHIMTRLQHVEEVKAYLSDVNLSALVTSMLVFVDRSGKYLIVEGDELIIGEDSEKVFSNFYYSQINNIEEVALENVKNGLEYLKDAEADTNLNYCGSVMNSLSSIRNQTQYATIYDLDRLVIRVYLYNDFEEFVEIDLMQELKKGKHSNMIVDLFPENSAGRAHFDKYNNSDDPAAFLREWIHPGEHPESDLIKFGFPFITNWIGYEWLIEKDDASSAIEIFKYGIELMPSVANLHDSLGEAYYKNNELDNAVQSYSKSIALDPENKNAKEMIDKIKSKMR